MAAALMAGCGRKDPTPTVTADASSVFHPCTGEVTVGQYKGLVRKVDQVTITDEDVNKQIQEFLSIRPNYVHDSSKDGRTVQNGDVVNIDFIGRKDGEAFEGGTAQGYDLEIGSGSFIDGFESGLVGTKMGDTVTVDATFPATYTNNPDLAGLTVQFEVTVNYFCKKSDDIDDAYVKKNSRSYTTAEDFKAFVRENLRKDAQAAADEESNLKLLDRVVESSTFGEIPEEDIQYYYRRLVAPYESYASQSGMELASFLKTYTDYSSPEELYARSRDLAISSVKQFMVLQKIAEAEGITVTDEEYNEYVTGVKNEGGYADNATVEQMFGKDFLTYSKQMEKALAFIADASVEG